MRDTLFLHALLALCELVFTDGPVGHFGIHPHPYWFIVLGMAAAHGVFAGLFSVGVGLVIQLGGLTAAHGLIDAFQIMVGTPEPTLLFLGAAFFVGEIHDAHARAHRALKRSRALADQTNERLRYETEVLFASIDRLKKRIEEQPVHLANLLESSSRMQLQGSEGLPDQVVQMIIESCGASKASYWSVPAQGGLQLAATAGWSEEERAPRIEASRTSALLEFAVRMRCTVKAFDFPESTGALDPILIAPVKDRHGTVVAVVCLDELPATLISPEAIAVFFGCADWASAAVSSQGGDEAPLAPGAGGARARRVLDALDLGERLRVEFDRSQRYGTPIGVGLIQAPEWSHRSEGALRELDAAVLTAYGTQLEGRQLYRFGHPGCYAIVLPGIDPDQTGEPLPPPSGETDIVFESCLMAANVESPDLASFLIQLDAYLRMRAQHALPTGVPIVVPPRAHIGTLDDLLRRIRTERTVSALAGGSCQVAVIPVWPEAAPTSAGLAPRLWVEALRPSDAIFEVGPEHLALILPGTDEAGAATAAARFTDTMTQTLALSESPFGTPRFVACTGEGFATLALLEQVEVKG